MGHRLTRIYTRTGDGGSTGLGDGTRVQKDSLRVEALGAVDELNSVIGVLLAEPVPEDVRGQLTAIQHDLFDLGGELSIPGYTRIAAGHVQQLEALLDAHNAGLEPLKEFILPGGSRRGAVPPGAHRVPARRAQSGEPRIRGDAVRVLPAIPQPPLGPAVRPEPRAQPPRRAAGCALAQGPGSGKTLMAPVHRCPARRHDFGKRSGCPIATPSAR
jgi:cob(I)alamin adenosyltransferase